MNNQKIIIVGVIEERPNRTTFRYIKELLIQSHFQIVYSNLKDNIIGFTREKITIVLASIEPEDLRFFQHMGIRFNILIHTFIKEKDSVKPLVSEQFKNCDYCILNSDEDNWTHLLSKSTEGIVITYGFNSKSTLTISSYNINQMIRANLCLQREIYPIEGKKLEPHEFYMEINSSNKDDIYPGLAAATFNLILGSNLCSNNIKIVMKSDNNR